MSDNYPIELGRKWSDSIEKGPSVPDEDAMHYPTLYLDAADGLGDLPDEGTMTIRFKKASETKSSGREGDRHSVSIDVTEIVSVEAEEPEEDDDEDDAGDALDKLKAARDAEGNDDEE